MGQSSINNVKASILKEGCLKCILNAQQLCDEAQLLHDNKMFARSYALSHFAREELAKSLMLLRAFGEKTAGKNVNWKRLNKRFRVHKQKITNDRLISTMLFSVLSEMGLDDYLRGIDFTNDRKNSCLYVDWEEEFTQPCEKIDEKLSNRNLKLAVYKVATFSKLINKLVENIEERALEIIQSPIMKVFYKDPEACFEGFKKSHDEGRLKPLSVAIRKAAFESNEN